VWAYFGVLERITMLETKSQLAEKDLNGHIERIEQELTANSEFRIKWPRGEMGALPDDAKQDLRIMYLQEDVETLKEVVKKLEIDNAKK
jgi:hypothetical protein